MEVDSDEEMSASEDEMSIQSKSPCQRIMEKTEAVKLAFAEKIKIEKEREAEIEVSVEKTTNSLDASDHIIECLMDLHVLTVELCCVRAPVARREADSLRVQLREKTGLAESLRLRVAKLEQERDEREKKADSLQLQLQEAMEVDASRRVQMAMLEQQLQKANESRRVQVAQAKEVEDSLRLQLHEQMIKCSSLQSQVAMLKPI